MQSRTPGKNIVDYKQGKAGKTGFKEPIKNHVFPLAIRFFERSFYYEH